MSPHFTACPGPCRILNEDLSTVGNQTVKTFRYLPQANEIGRVELACEAEQLMDGLVVFATKDVATTVVVTRPQPLPALTVIGAAKGAMP